MKTLLRDLAEGTVFKMEENGSSAQFVVAKHNYLTALNGTGHTLMIRKEPLDEKRPWWDRSYDAPENMSWGEDSDLRPWMEDVYSTYLSEELRAAVKPLTLKYTVNGYYSEKTLENAKFFVPSPGDVDSYYHDSDKLSDDVLKLLCKTKGDGAVCWTRSTISYTGGTVGSEYETSHVVELLGYTSTASKLGNRTSSGWGYDKNYVLPCFALYDDRVALCDDGVLRANHAPEIKSYYFGTETVHGKAFAFKVPYSVTDADGDEITVTEYLDGTAVRSYKAVDGQTNQFSVTQEMLDGLSDEYDHELKVTATDGIAVSGKSYLLHKVSASGYVVYIGQIAGTEDKTGYYWTERHVLHDPADETAPIILDPEVTLEKNQFGSFVFTLPVSNPYADKIGLKKTVISVEEDGTEIFMGYVTELEKNFDLDIEVTCEGELGYLQDRDCVVEAKAYTIEELVKLALTPDEDYGERFLTEGKAFNAGTVNVAKPESEKDDKETKNVSDCWSILNNLAENYGGYLRLRKIIKMENGVRVYRRYLDYLTDISDQTDQMIQFGVNLLDLSYYVKSNTIVNSLIVLGYETTGWFIFSNTHPIHKEVVNAESIERYGLCQRILIVDGTNSTPELLEKKGKEELTKYSSSLFSGSITINAADLADVGVDTDRLQFMKKTRVLSEAHGLKNWILCTKEVIPLDAPEEKSFTFGDSVSSLSALQAANFGTAGKAWNAIQSTIRYIGSGGE